MPVSEVDEVGRCSHVDESRELHLIVGKVVGQQQRTLLSIRSDEEPLFLTVKGGLPLTCQQSPILHSREHEGPLQKEAIDKLVNFHPGVQLLLHGRPEGALVEEEALHHLEDAVVQDDASTGSLLDEGFFGVALRQRLDLVGLKREGVEEFLKLLRVVKQ